MWSASQWLLAQARFCGRTHLPLSPNSTTLTVQVIFRYLRPDAPVFNITTVGMLTFRQSPSWYYPWADIIPSTSSDTQHLCVIFGPSTQPKNAIPRWYTGRKWHIPMASNRKRSRGWIKAYDMGQGEGPIVPLIVMHRKRVTSELHDSYFRLMTIKHPIQRSSMRSCGRWVII